MINAVKGHLGKEIEASRSRGVVMQEWGQRRAGRCARCQGTSPGRERNDRS